jgi:hypothetical protein
MFIFTRTYIMLAIVNKYIFIYWIIFHLTIYGHHAIKDIFQIRKKCHA